MTRSLFSQKGKITKFKYLTYDNETSNIISIKPLYFVIILQTRIHNSIKKKKKDRFIATKLLIRNTNLKEIENKSLNYKGNPK